MSDTEKAPEPTVIQLEVRDESDETIAAFDMSFSNEVGAPPAADLQLMTPNGSAFATVSRDAALVILRIPVPVKAGKVKKPEPAPEPVVEEAPKEEASKGKK